MIKELWTLVKMLFGTRPSDHVCNGMGIVEMKHFPFKGYKAMAWCGNIIHRIGTSEVDDVTMNHEKIHLMQAVLCNDSWVKYYLVYVWEWLRGNPFIAPASSAYMTIPQEMEAYANEGKSEYPECMITYSNDYSHGRHKRYVVKNRKKVYKEHVKDWELFIKTL